VSHSLVKKQDQTWHLGFLCFFDFLLKANKKFSENLDLQGKVASCPT